MRDLLLGVHKAGAVPGQLREDLLHAVRLRFEAEQRHLPAQVQQSFPRVAHCRRGDSLLLPLLALRVHREHPFSQGLSNALQGVPLRAA